MNKKDVALSGCSHLGLISLISSVLGSALAATVYAAINPHVNAHESSGGVSDFLLVASMVFFFGLFLAVPVGLAVGIPLMALSRRYLAGHVVLATIVFAIMGLFGGLAIRHLGGSNDIDNVQLVFGACVGGMHPLVFGRANGLSWYRVGAALLLGAIIVPSLAYAGKDVVNLIESRAEFESRCDDYYGVLATIADRAALERHGSRLVSRGVWRRDGKWRSLYAREDRVALDEARILIARDYAFVPSGLAGMLTGGRRVERHCLTEKTGDDAEMLRRRGFGKRPTLEDLYEGRG